ncbi:MAG: HlyD family efflux transporter periplasmic adaptor subunit [Gammaproteobacteria bacterium]|nr:HlyD family efflux transporter periplasmic adaptor subunit [Gammaproteobacteria bacterium]
MSSDHQNTGESPVVVAQQGDEESLWSSLKESHNPKAVASSWLEIQSRLIGDAASCGVVVLGEPDQGPFTPVAVWPAGVLGSPVLAEAVEVAVNKRKLVVRDSKRITNEGPVSGKVMASPLLVDNQICGAVAFDLDQVEPERLSEIQELIEWGSGWLEVYIHRNKFTSSDRLVTVLELVATSLHHQRFQEAAIAVVTELSAELGCERVAIGFLSGQHSRVRALSHSASFGKKGNLIRAIEAAMDEAIDQQTTVVYPPLNQEALQVSREHEALAKLQDEESICTVPLIEGDKLLGAIVFERPADQPFDESTVQLCQHTASLLGPLLDVKRREDRWITSKMFESMVNLLKSIFGPRHFGLKLGSLILAGLIAFFILAEDDYRVTADARLEGTIQRAVTSPTAGYVIDANVRAGDVVKQNDLLFSLDDRDLRLERMKWESQKLQSKREHSEAVAEHDRARTRILSAQIEQADAEIALLDEQLGRMQVKAPFDSFVVTGDMSQSLGAPVERGDILFELAPLNSYRVILEVDERDIDDISIDQVGELALTSAPQDLMPISVERITPLSSAVEGRNFFRVEARLNGEISELLRPGMEGVGKIDIDRRKLIWIWSHKIIHWFRMFFWSWWP